MTDKELIISKIELGIKGLEFQKGRILRGEAYPPSLVSPVHDSDFYMVILRRLYRTLEKQAKINSSVANLKGKYQHLYKQIKLRDHYEHDIDMANFPTTPQVFKIITSVVITKNAPKIISGDKEWNLNKEHEEFILLMNQFLQIIK